ncbi:MAG: GNAT family N-acetyltransferase [Patescibacteria group bacterium]
MKKSAQGKKYAKETLSAIIHRAQNHISYKYLLYHVCVDNIPSIRLIESLG